MPTYEYECSKCGRKFDVFQKMSDKPVAPCPKCKGKADRLISSGAGFIFKGTGFYHTDYKNPPRKDYDSIPSEARDRNKGKGDKKTDKPPCQKEKSDGCKGCSMHED